MADAAFKTAAFPGLTTAELRVCLTATEGRAAGGINPGSGYYQEDVSRDDAKASAMRAEIERRERVAGGDKSSMTSGERLRHARGN